MKILNIFKLLNPKYLLFSFTKYLRNLKKSYELYQIANKNPTLYCEENVQIISPEKLSLGKDILLMQGAIVHCGGMSWSNYQGQITIGDRCVIGPYSILCGAGEIVIEEDVELAYGTKIMAQEGNLDDGMKTRFEKGQLKFEKVRIGAGSWITSGAIVLAGSDIGKKCIIGPNSVVKGKIPDHSLVLGNPGRVVKKLN